jgi:hypothetical protein
MRVTIVLWIAAVLLLVVIRAVLVVVEVMRVIGFEVVDPVVVVKRAVATGPLLVVSGLDHKL